MRRIYLIEERPNPSTDLFVAPAIDGPDVDLQRCGFDEVPRRDRLTGADIIFVRYLPAAWVRALSARDVVPARIALFIDDDVLDPGASRGLPWRYRWKLGWLAARRLGWLRQHGAELWVGSEYLRQRYAAWQPHLLRPRPWRALQKPTRVFYHGSASHRHEHAWVHALMGRVLASEPSICFEVVAQRDLARSYQRLPRTWVVAPMSWPSYQAFVAQPGRDIGLAPLLPSAFNAARAATKFFDITRAGAVGLYGRGGSYEEIVDDGDDGLLLPPDPERWAAALSELARDPARREWMFERAMRKLDATEPGSQTTGTRSKSCSSGEV